MADWDIAEPRADALVESLRAFGYSPEAAVADLIDNSISAGARTVDIDFLWDGTDSRVLIHDDGVGMDSDALVSAMRAGSTSPLEKRDSRDLGRFGLGLKTASFSQAQELTVMSKASTAYQPAVRRWDLNVIAQTGEWRLLRTPPANVQVELPHATSGTLVMWTKCDRLVGHIDRKDTKAQSRFNQMIRRVTSHLEAVFHRFMSGRGKITIRVNGQVLKPWDPFMESHPATQNLGTESLPLKGTEVEVTPFVLPHRSKLTEVEQETGSGAHGWNQQQGFYIYRSNRLLVQGDWLGLGLSKDEHTKLARILVDFPAALDHDWQVDVKKSLARAPGPLQADLRRVASVARRRAEEVYRHRGKFMVRRTSKEFVMAWRQVKRRNGEVAYRINRDHPVISTLLDISPDSQRLVERALHFIEETIPTTLIGVSIADALDRQPAPFSESRPELAPLLEFVFDGLLDEGVAPEEALDRIAAAEPFVQYPEVIQTFKERL